MSGKLDQTLDEILSTQKRAAGARRRSTRKPVGRTAPAAPSGGVQKATKPARNASKVATAKSSGAIGESKIMVSNLPKDVSEAQIKEYFQGSIGQVKRVELSYGPNSVSRGIAHVTFPHADGATKAFKALNGVLVDNRPIKVEVVVASAELIPQPKTLGQRMTSQSKAQPKSAAAIKRGAAAATTKTGATGKPTKKAAAARRGRNGRPTKKTADELDAEMADYFDGAPANNENANNGAPATTGGDAMVDDIE